MTPPRLEPGRGRADTGWRKPRQAPPNLLRYIETVRERIWLVVGVMVLTLAAATLYLATADKVYEAQSELLVTPVAEDDPALTGLALIRSSSDPSRDVETVARLVTSRAVAAEVRAELSLDESPQDLADSIDASPVAQSNIVVISARENDPELAADIANSFAENAVADRDEKLRVQLKPLLESLQLRATDASLPRDARVTLTEQLTRLESLEAGGDPTIRFETSAAPPDSPVAPRPALTIAAGLIGGLVLGLGAAFLMQAVDPRLRREEQLRERYGLPILARIPRERKGIDPESQGIRRSVPVPLGPSSLSPRTLEAYRTLRTMLSAAGVPAEGEGGPVGRAILVTGPSPVDGKTTTAINLASSYALAGKRVILIEADFRRPKIAAALKVTPRRGIGDVLLGEASLDDALVSVKPFGDELRVLPVQKPDDQVSELLSMPTARRLLDSARELADYVVVDSPPLTEVVDTLPLAHCVDDLLLVCRIGGSSLLQLSRLADLLEQNGIEPRGFVVIGVAGSEGSYYFESAGKGPELGPEDGTPKRPRSKDSSGGPGERLARH
jgi:tyrosine-protein kinase